MRKRSSGSTRAFVRRAARRAGRSRRRGVVSVVSMMFLILFGSLAAAMAIMSRGNLITAATHQHVTRALGAAETGLAVSELRLQEAARRFSVSKGEVDAGFGARIWSGAFLVSDGALPASDPVSFVNTFGTPDGMVDALQHAHAMDLNTVEVNSITTPTITQRPAGADPAVYALDNWLVTPAVAVQQQSGIASSTAFQVTYAPLTNGTDIRVIVTGYDFDYNRSGEPITRRIMQDFRIVKRVDAAVVSPSRIMIGKNVLVEGDLGAVYEEVETDYGDPLVIRSDFHGLDAQLDDDLDKLFLGIKNHDVDQDNRLRVGHPTESQGIPDLDGNGSPDGSALDVSQDGKVDEFDLFLRRYDTNGDGMVALSNALRAGTPAAALAAEFVNSGNPVDDDLALLIDSAMPDRNRNKVYSYQDVNVNGRFDPGTDTLDDTETVTPGMVPPNLLTYVHNTPPPDHVWSDQVLGYRDGVIDRRDLYAKVSGRLMLRVTSNEWSTGQGAYMDRIQGPLNPGPDASAMEFDVSAAEVPEITPSSFNNAENSLKLAADGAPFIDQVASNLGVSVMTLATWTPAQNPAGAGSPKYLPLYADANQDGLPDNHATAYFEKAPFNSPNYADWYYRPVYENMVFKNVQLPMGCNALFKNCTFVGVTYIRSYLSNTHVDWTIYGKLKLSTSTSRPVLDPPRFIYGDGAGETSYPSMLPSSAVPPNQFILMAETPLDKADIPQNQVPLTVGYSSLPDPLVINGKRIVDSKPFGNNIRFHDSLFVGSIVSDAPVAYTHVRNKLQFTGGTRFVQEHPTQPANPTLNPDPEDVEDIAKSSLMVPQYSVDIGQFNSPPSQDVRLRGTIVAGVLDVRGNASIDGCLLLTFKPQLGSGPLVDPQGNPVGNPSLFNTTLGYFGPDDGDDESLDPRTLPMVSIAGTPTKIVGYDTNGDGLPDVGPTGLPPPGAVPVPFYGYGAINLKFDPNLTLPDGLTLPLQIDIQRVTYREASK